MRQGECECRQSHPVAVDWSRRYYIAEKKPYRIRDTVAGENGDALDLIVRRREDESVGFIVLIVAEEGQWEALGTLLRNKTLRY